MNRRLFLKSCVCAVGAMAAGRSVMGGDRNLSADGNSLPNIVFILADDMGYGDIQAYNPRSTIPTPNLNHLAGQGIRFTDAHSGSAVCTPTRYGVLTGRYCWRTRLKSGVLFPPHDKPLIEPERLTVAGMLKKRGYHTACIGKWHLGIEWGRDFDGKVDFNKPISYGPTDVGFDYWFGVAASLDMVPYTFYRNHDPVQKVTETQPALKFPKFIRKGPKAADFDPGKVLDTLTQEAVDYIAGNSRKNKPFFLYLPLTAPHKPVWPAERFKEKTDLGPYGDFVAQVDDSVGRVLRALEQAGVVDDTLVFYTSDNGSYMYRLAAGEKDHVQDPGVQGYRPKHHQPNSIYRGTKADIWEAGHRVPLIVRWPGRIKPGMKCRQTVCLTDFFATCAQVVGFDLPEDSGEDSFSLTPLLLGKSPHKRAPVVNHSVSGMFALRDGKWKMVFGNGSGGRERPRGRAFQRPYKLFDLEKDPGETTNVIDKHPAVAERMEQMLKEIRQKRGGRF